MGKFIISFFICLQILFADLGSIKGTITDEDSGEPIGFANVFLSGTTIGTSSNEDGDYHIKDIPEGKYKLVVSVVGFKSADENIQINNNDNMEIDFELVKKTYELEEIAVTGEFDKEYQENYLKFRKHFIGTSENALSCEITNPGILDFDKDDKNLVATSQDALEIINHNLGYKIKVFLKKFELTKRGEVYYSGETLFTEIDTTNENVKAVWSDNRQEAYNGSMRNFFSSLFNDTWYSEGFRIYLSSRPTWKNVYDIMQQEQPISYDLQKDVMPSYGGYKKLRIKENVLIKYIKEIEASEYYAYREEMDSNINEILPYQISWIELINNSCEFDKNGLLRYPDNSIKVYGYWGWLKMGDMLPFNYDAMNN